MTNIEALSICEGFKQPVSHVEEMEAWQHIADTGIAWQTGTSLGAQVTVLLQIGKLKARCDA